MASSCHCCHKHAHACTRPVERRARVCCSCGDCPCTLPSLVWCSGSLHLSKNPEVAEEAQDKVACRTPRTVGRLHHCRSCSRGDGRLLRLRAWVVCCTGHLRACVEGMPLGVRDGPPLVWPGFSYFEVGGTEERLSWGGLNTFSLCNPPPFGVESRYIHHVGPWPARPRPAVLCTATLHPWIWRHGPQNLMCC